MKVDIATYNANKPADKDIFTMTVAGKTYDDRKEAGAAIIGICKEMKQANVAVPIGEYLGMKMNVTFDSFFRKFTLNMKGKLSHEVEIGSDPSGNIIMGGVCLDINPISQEKTGSLSEYLTGVETYLADRQATMEMEVIEPMMTREDMKPAPVITYTVAECGEFHSQGAYRDDIPTIEQTKAIYDAISEEHRNMIPAVGMKLRFLMQR